MPWLERIAKLLWGALPLVAWFLETLLILWAFPPAVVRELILPAFPAPQFFGFYGSVTVSFIVVYFALLLALVTAWALAFRSVVGPAGQLIIVRGKYPPGAPVRRLGEFVVHFIHDRA